MRRILDAIADVAILAALVVAGIGQFMPWMVVYSGPTDISRSVRSAVRAALPGEARSVLPGEAGAEPDLPTAEERAEFQMWHVTRSGAALATAGVLVLLSLTLNLGTAGRKLLVVLMFASLAAAICFEVMIYTPLPITQAHVEFGQFRLMERPGFLVALVPTIIAAVVCAARMIWTMAWRPKRDADRPPLPA
jgi:hypothetical protein